ncbi:hypothetical protein HHK36_006618 [Tetracentron sinense]|uniref:Uncharacterized protein n=1 Tax=Tetracentron sinense TaxID=13715 RepID=A0A834ZHT4_TETSI|nr:hypothetical protein HHK36_006618 [Tetracentron sinense]
MLENSVWNQSREIVLAQVDNLPALKVCEIGIYASSEIVLDNLLRNCNWRLPGPIRRNVSCKGKEQVSGVTLRINCETPLSANHSSMGYVSIVCYVMSPDAHRCEANPENLLIYRTILQIVKTVGSLLWALLRKKCRTLTCAPTNTAACAPTNTAVVEVTKRLRNLVRKDEDEEEDLLTIGEFIEKRFDFIEEGLKLCIVNLYTHLPTSFISLGVVENMIRALSLLESLGTLLHTGTYTSEEINSVFKHLNDEESTVTCSNINFCLQSAYLIFCTASTSANLHIEGMTPLELLVVDEASQLKECESAIPLQLPDIRHAILIGDERQLPAMVNGEICEKAEFGRSLFERMLSLGQEKHLLNVQYRMHPSISSFPNMEFYNKQISNARNVQERSYEKQFLQEKMYGSYSFINVAYGKEDSHARYKNMVEVAVVANIVGSLFKASVATKKRVSVGVISPNNAQKLVVDAKDRGCFYNADEDKSLAEAMIDSMVALNQLYDLFRMDSLLFRCARWNVSLSDDCKKSMERIKSVETRKEVVSSLMKLSSGWRHHPKEGNLSLIDATSQMLEQYSVDELLKLVWSVDIHKEKSNYIQVLNIWDILPFPEIPKLSKRLEVVFENYTVANMNRCRLKCIEGDLEVPKSWPICSNEAEDEAVDYLSSHFDSLNL